MNLSEDTAAAVGVVSVHLMIARQAAGRSGDFRRVGRLSHKFTGFAWFSAFRKFTALDQSRIMPRAQGSQTIPNGG